MMVILLVGVTKIKCQAYERRDKDINIHMQDEIQKNIAEWTLPLTSFGEYQVS